MLTFVYVHNIVINDQTEVVVSVDSVQTVQGLGPVVVTTPVIDLQTTQRVSIATRPVLPESLMLIEWRNSQTAFHPDSLLPSWQSGEPGSGRYWQVRVTLLSPDAILDRIELLPYTNRSSEQAMTFNL